MAATMDEKDVKTDSAYVPSKELNITDCNLKDNSNPDQSGGVSSIPDLPPEASSSSPVAETFDSVPKEMPDVPIATPESMEIQVPKKSVADAKLQNLGGKGSKKVNMLLKTAKAKKADKGIEHILHALKSLETPEEKLAALCKRYTDLLDDHRLLQNKCKQNDKKLQTLIKDKEQLQSENSKSILAKSKLENLCRELQRHSKLVKDESIARAKEEEGKRKEVTAKFQTTINDIKEQVDDHTTRNTQLREENQELVGKLTKLVEQYEQREEYVTKMLKHKELEVQLLQAKNDQAGLQLKEEQENSQKEKELFLVERAKHKETIEILQSQEKQLRSQVALYTEKYEQFQDTLSQSQTVFQTFKTDMDKMTKKIKRLEKETVKWKTKWEKGNHTLLEMAEDKTRTTKEMAILQTRIDKLQGLCRALQDDRRKTQQSEKEAKVEANGHDSIDGKTTPSTQPPPHPDRSFAVDDSPASPESSIKADSAAISSTSDTDEQEQEDEIQKASEEESKTDGASLEDKGLCHGSTADVSPDSDSHNDGSPDSSSHKDESKVEGNLDGSSSSQNNRSTDAVDH